jgi:hypothetical protein
MIFALEKIIFKRELRQRKTEREREREKRQK